MTAAANHFAPPALVILLVVATAFNDLQPFLPLGELSRDAFVYLFPIGFLYLILRPGQITFPVGFTLLFMAFLVTIITSVVMNYNEISVAYFKQRTGMSRVITQGMAVALGPLVTLLFYNFVKRGHIRGISRGAEIALWVMGAFGVLEIASWYNTPILTQIFEILSLVLHAETNSFYPVRLRLTAFEASWTAVMMTFVFPFAMTRASPRKLLVYAAFVMFAMVLAQSRTAMLAVGFQFLMLILAFMRRQKDYFVYVTATFCFTILTLFMTPGVQQNLITKVSNLIEFGNPDGMIDPNGGFENVSNVTRLAAIEAGRSMFEERPVFGVGFGQYGFNYPSHVRMDDMRSWEVRSYVTEADIELAWPPAYSLHIRLLAELGMFGYFLWLALILPPLLRSLRMADGMTYLGRMHLAVAMTLTGWMLLGASIDSFRFFGGWIALGVGLALSRPPRGYSGSLVTSPSDAAWKPQS
ncbi:MAG: O-antigen ligase family protein [Paracoccus sp. (in: a-proteobacteria)]